MKTLKDVLFTIGLFIWIAAAASAFMFILTALTSCSMVSQNMTPGTVYKRDIQFKVNEIQGDGVLVVPRAKTYHIEAQTNEKGSFDFVLITSCHREIPLEKQGDSFEIDYTPVPGLEDTKACPLRIRGFDQAHSRDSWGFIDFESPHDILPSTMECNGAKSTPNGVSVCQSKESLTERITFPVDVDAAWSPNKPQCAIPGTSAQKVWEFKMPIGECLIVFGEHAEPHRLHRMNLIGYQEVLPRHF